MPPTCPTITPPVASRQQDAQNIRDQADALANRPIPQHVNNCEEAHYPSYIFNYSKALQHDALGDPIPASYQSLINALQVKTHAAFDTIADGPGPKKQTNPQAGLQYQLEGYDPQALTMPPAPRNDRARAAAEMGELYWMALARDVPFINYDAQYGTAGSIIQRAARSLSSPWWGGEFTEFAGPKVLGRVTARTLFRGIYPGELVGPYVSQFLLKGNSTPAANGLPARSAKDGLITYGSQVIDQRQRTAVAGIDHLKTFAPWLQAQNGTDFRGGDQLDPTKRFIRNLRDGATYVHLDLVINAWYNTAFYLLSEPTGTQLAANAGTVVMRDREFPFDQGNPYLTSVDQDGFITLGPVQAVQLVTNVITRAGAAVWFQKWFVHRRLRPEELGGRIHNHLTGARWYPIHYQILNSLQGGLLSNYFTPNTGYLLPQAYAEGAPTHPAYGSGHAAISGACATILKAFFNEETPIENPVQASADGLTLVDYTGTDRTCMTVGSELNKLAGNIAIFRNAAGVHWRTDYDQSLLLGEQVAIEVLREISLTMNEPEAFYLTKFNGRRIRIQNGQVYASWYFYRPCPWRRFPWAQVAHEHDPVLQYAYPGAPFDQALANPEWEKQSGGRDTTYREPTFESVKKEYDAGGTGTVTPAGSAMATPGATAEPVQPVDGEKTAEGEILDSSLDIAEAADGEAESFTAAQEPQDEARYRAEVSKPA